MSSFDLGLLALVASVGLCSTLLLIAAVVLGKRDDERRAWELEREVFQHHVEAQAVEIGEALAPHLAAYVNEAEIALEDWHRYQDRLAAAEWN